MRPVRVEVPEAALRDLRERLERTRRPEAETVADWSQGVPLAYLRELCDYRARESDWRATEARLNALPQFRTEIDGLGIHLIHVRSARPDAMPLVLTHGRPGSVVEFPQGDRAARRGRRRRVPRRLPLAPGLRLQRQAGGAGVGRGADRRRVGAADGAAGLRALRRGGQAAREQGEEVDPAWAGAPLASLAGLLEVER